MKWITGSYSLCGFVREIQPSFKKYPITWERQINTIQVVLQGKHLQWLYFQSWVLSLISISNKIWAETWNLCGIIALDMSNRKTILLTDRHTKSSPGNLQPHLFSWCSHILTGKTITHVINQIYNCCSFLKKSLISLQCKQWYSSRNFASGHTTQLILKSTEPSGNSICGATHNILNQMLHKCFKCFKCFLPTTAGWLQTPGYCWNSETQQETQSERTNREVTAARQRSRAACKPELTHSKHTPINMPDAARSHEPKLPQQTVWACPLYTSCSVLFGAQEGTNHCIEVTASRSSRAFTAYCAFRNAQE